MPVHSAVDVTPEIGPAVGGTNLVVNGTELDRLSIPAPLCRIGVAVNAGTLISPSSVKCTAPPLRQAAGVYDHPHRHRDRGHDRRRAAPWHGEGGGVHLCTDQPERTQRRLGRPPRGKPASFDVRVARGIRRSPFRSERARSARLPSPPGSSEASA